MSRLAQKYIYSVAGILILTCAAKLYSTTGGAKVLDLPEALLPMSNRQALWMVGLIELALALVLLIGNNLAVKLVAIAWLGCNFALYRLGSQLLTVGRPCPCLGSITEKLPLKPTTIDHFLTGVVLYLFFGSLFFLLELWNRKPSAGSREPPGETAELEA